MANTPLTDFLSTLADPANLHAFRLNPAAYMERARLAKDLRGLIQHGHAGAIRVRAVMELERAGLAPQVSDKFGNAAQQPTYTSTNYNVNTYNTNTYTYNTNTYNTNTYNTNTTTNSSGPENWRIVEIIQQAIQYFEKTTFRPNGELVIVGSGIRAIADLTLGAEAHIRKAQKVFYCVADPVIERRLHQLNSTAESLYGLYGNDKPRIQTYHAMVDAILGAVRAGQAVCAVFYGHPGVFAWPAHQAIRLVRLEGFRAEMKPAVSADASLFADLGIDPSQPGYHSLEATELLIRRRQLDVASHVLIWQAECVGDQGFNFAGYKRHNFKVLLEYLRKFYPPKHPVIIYEAAALPQAAPLFTFSQLDTIRKEDLTGISTLYLPPAMANPTDLDMCERLGLPAPGKLSPKDTKGVTGGTKQVSRKGAKPAKTARPAPSFRSK